MRVAGEASLKTYLSKQKQQKIAQDSIELPQIQSGFKEIQDDVVSTRKYNSNLVQQIRQQSHITPVKIRYMKKET